MRFLIDEYLPRSTDFILRRYGHEAADVRGIGLRGAKDSQIASYAQSEGLCLVTGDFDFSDIRNYPPGEYAGLVVLKLPRTANASFILNLLESFLQQEDLASWRLWNPVGSESGRLEAMLYALRSELYALTFFPSLHSTKEDFDAKQGFSICSYRVFLLGLSSHIWQSGIGGS